MSQITKTRVQALAILAKQTDDNEYVGIDYEIDDYLRKVFKLPNRPPGAEPYVGWMVGEGKEVNKKYKTSQAGIDLIKRWEGLRTKAYVCPAGVLTIGYGHTRNVHPNQVITSQEAEQLLREDLLRYEKAVNELVEKPLSQHQFDALVSFTYNVGISAFRNSTMLRLLNIGNSFQAASQFSRWVNGGGRKLEGLVRRREDERRLFLS